MKNYDELTAQLLFNRGFKTKKSADEFLHPDYEKLHDPYLLKDMKKAVGRITKAIEKREPIVVYGDYDVDGVTATAILYRSLKELGADVRFYIPDRMKEGYGMNVSAIDALADEGAKLIITVDNGISSHKEVLHAKKRKIDIVVTDHHEITKENVPEGFAVINPKQKGDKYPCKDLCGAGVAFKLVTALVAAYEKKKIVQPLSLGKLKWYLDLTALGTISDVVSLVDENRIIVSFGLKVLAKTRNIGLQSLAYVAGIDLEKSDPYTVGFQIGPRLNAAGRMAHATTALELLITEDRGLAEMLALRLERLNRERQDTVADSLEILKSEYAERELESILVLKNDEWSVGIIGLIAGRMSEEFARPVFALAYDGKVLKGSIRSSINFSVIDALTANKDIFLGYGGHRAAGGFSLHTENFEIFREKIIEYGDSILTEKDFVKNLEVEGEMDFEKINSETYENIKKLQPFGAGNREPIFATMGVKVKETKRMGEEGKHLRLVLVSGGREINAVAFGMGDLATDLYYGRDIDVAYTISENIWGERRRIEIRVKDVRIQ